MKNSDLSKEVDNCEYKKLLIENMAEKQRYHEKIKENCLEKGRRYYEENKERLQKTSRDRYQGVSEE